MGAVVIALLDGRSVRAISANGGAMDTSECLEDFLDENNPVRVITFLSMRSIWPDEF
jgi:hypothetical protein